MTHDCNLPLFPRIGRATLRSGKASGSEALLLLGWLHDAWCTNRPDEARRYYGRLAAMEANPDACFSGLYMAFTMLAREKKWAELIELGDRICGRFPQIHEHRQRSINWWRDHAQKQLADEN